MYKFRAVFFLFVISGIPFMAFAASQDAVATYKTKYQAAMIKQLKPMLSEQMKKSGINEKDINARINKISLGMASCAVEAFKFYDEHYAKIAFDTVAAGGSIQDSNKKVEALMDSDIASGKSTQEKVVAQVQKYVEHMRDCTSKAARTDREN